jgi:hypothetical protein
MLRHNNHFQAIAQAGCGFGALFGTGDLIDAIRG